MATIQGEELADLVASVINDKGKSKITDLSSTITKYFAAKRLLRKKRAGFSSGTELEFNLMLNGQGNSRHVGMFSQDQIAIADSLKVGKVPWKHLTGGYGYDEREMAMNRNPGRITDLIATRQYGSRVDDIKTFETDFWSKPDSATDSLTPFGIAYWCVYNGTDGFTGGAPFGSTVANINPSTITAWKNYAFTYTAVTKADLIAKWKKSVYDTDFEAPVEGIASYDDDAERTWCTTYNVTRDLETLYEQQNDNLGLDVAPGIGAVTFNRNKVVAVPKLDTLPAAGSEPIYGIPWGVFRTVFLKGYWEKTTGPVRKAGSHLLWEIFTDTTYNFTCYDRRQFVIGATAAPY